MKTFFQRFLQITAVILVSSRLVAQQEEPTSVLDALLQINPAAVPASGNADLKQHLDLFRQITRQSSITADLSTSPNTPKKPATPTPKTQPAGNPSAKLGIKPRRAVGSAEGSPFDAIGLITVTIRTSQGIQKKVGTGILIGPNHVLTAAHVLFPEVEINGEPYRVPRDPFAPRFEDVVREFRRGISGTVDKVLPIEIFNHRIDCPDEFFANKMGTRDLWPYDYAIAELDSPINIVQYLEIKELATSLISESYDQFHLTGYDSDWDGVTVNNRRMIDRGAPITVLGSDPRIFVGHGWSAAHEASGGPIWAVIDGKPTVFGIYSESRSDKSSGLRTGRIINQSLYENIQERLRWKSNYPGPTARGAEIYQPDTRPSRMIAERARSADQYALEFMAYPPGTLVPMRKEEAKEAKGAYKSFPGHIYVAFKKNGVIEKLKGFQPEGQTYLPSSGSIHETKSDVEKEELATIATTRFSVKVDAKTYDSAMAIDKEYYLIVMNDCVTYAAAVAKEAGLKCPGITGGVLHPTSYVDALKALNAAAP